MFAKLVPIVLALGACGCTLLALRQSRLQIASEVAQTQIRINLEDERLWVLRARIAERVTPDQVEQMATTVGPLRPLVGPDSLTAFAKAEEAAKSGPQSRNRKPSAKLDQPLPTRLAQRETHR